MKKIIFSILLLLVSAFTADSVTTQVASTLPFTYENNVLFSILGPAAFFCLKVAVNLAVFAITFWMYHKTGFRMVWWGCIIFSIFQWICAINNIAVISHVILA